MDLVPQRLEQWWRGLDDRGRRHASVIALISVGYIGHYLVYCLPQPFFIEDAAITFSYARNLVEGEGLVTWPGGERVEGYSNALWTFLMAALYALGVPMWTASKVMGAVFGVAVLGLEGGTFIANVRDSVEWSDVQSGLLKALVFSFAMAWVATFRGFFARGGAEGVGLSTMAAVVEISVLILIGDYVMTALLF